MRGAKEADREKVTKEKKKKKKERKEKSARRRAREEEGAGERDGVDGGAKVDETEKKDEEME